MKRSWNIRSIESLILGFFLIRLYGIFNPPLETWHSWRQTLTSMMARNFSEGGYSVFYPKVDQAGELSGIIGSEFPFFQTLIAGCNDLLGYEHWYGRLINLIVCSIASWAFFKLIQRWWNDRTAWLSTVVFLVSLWFSFSRKTMPDTFAVSLVIIGIFWFQRYFDQRKVLFLLLGTLLITLGGLCKIPAVFLFALIVTVWGSRSIVLRLKLRVTAAVGVASIIIGWWYFIWVPHLVNTYGFQLYFPKGILEGLNEIAPLKADFFKQFYFGALRSYVALLPLVLGIWWLCFRRNRLVGMSVLALTAVFVLFAIKTGTVFPTHNYYVLPFVPVMAVAVGLGLQRIRPVWSVVLVIVIAVEGIANQWTDFRVKDEVKYRLSLETQVNTLVPKGEKIIIHFGPNPEWMYWYHRKGWSLDENAFVSPETLKQIRGFGGKYMVVDKRVWTVPLTQKKVGETADLVVYLND